MSGIVEAPINPIETQQQTFITPQIQRYREAVGSISPIKVAEILGTPLHDGQKEIARLFERDTIMSWSEATVLISRRWGKSYLGKILATTQLLHPQVGASVLVVCHSTSLADTWHKEILQFLHTIPQLKGKIQSNKNDGVISLDEFGSSLIVCSYLNAEARAIGKAFSFILWDERFAIPTNDQETLYNLITPATANFGSLKGIKYAKQVTLSTPRESATASLAGRQYLQGMEKKNGFISFKKTVWESPFLTYEEKCHLRDTLPPEIFAQEYLAEFMKTSTTSFRMFDKAKHIQDIPIQYLKDMAHHCTLVASLDAGYADGSGASIVLYNNRSKIYYIIDEFYKKEVLSDEFLKDFVKRWNQWIVELNMQGNEKHIFYDPSAPALGAELVRDYNLIAQKAYVRDKAKNIDQLNQMLYGEGGKNPKIIFRKECVQTAEHFEFAEFKTANGQVTSEFKRIPNLGHHFELCDTVLYSITTTNRMASNTIIVT